MKLIPLFSSSPPSHVHHCPLHEHVAPSSPSVKLIPLFSYILEASLYIGADVLRFAWEYRSFTRTITRKTAPTINIPTITPIGRFSGSSGGGEVVTIKVECRDCPEDVADSGGVVIARKVVGPDGLTDAVEGSDDLVDVFGGGTVEGPDGLTDDIGDVVKGSDASVDEVVTIKMEG